MHPARAQSNSRGIISTTDDRLTKAYFYEYFLNLKLQVLGPRYYPIKFKENIHFKDLKFILNSELYVKQKNGYFSYSDDPKVRKQI